MTESNGTHKTACPRRYDPSDDCMCNYIKPKPRSKRKERATSPSAVRKIALNYAQSSGNGATRFKRVSDRFLAKIERNALDFIRKQVDHQDKKGMTLF